MHFQVNAEAQEGFIAWLGGRYGAGALMLYQREPESRALWSSKQDRWHYDTDYVLRAETRPGGVRVRQLAADGQTVISDSTWIEADPKYTGKEGLLGFQTWSGTAEFWGFSEATRATGETEPSAGKPPAASKPPVARLGDGWESHGDGTWQWVDAKRTRLRLAGDAEQAMVLNRGLTGMEGTWRCRARLARPTGAAGLAFQASADAAEGFACLLSGDGARLESLDGRTLWESNAWKPSAESEYVLEGVVATDRVAVRVLAADGKTVLSQSPDVYVPESNNTRRGHLGLLVRRGNAEFWDWQPPRP